MHRKSEIAIALAESRTRPQVRPPNIEPPLNMSLTPTITRWRRRCSGKQPRTVLRKTLGYDDRRIA